MREKDELRERAMEFRRAATREEQLKKSALIMERLFQTGQFRRAKNVMFFCAKNGEVDTSLMIKSALELGKRVIVPITDTERGVLTLSELRDPETELGKGAFDVPEPKKGHRRPVEADEVDLFVVPGLAFDGRGNRLGLGYAYFDKLLAEKRKDAGCIGLAYEAQIFPQVTVEPHDVPVEKVITEARVLDCARD